MRNTSALEIEIRLKSFLPIGAIPAMIYPEPSLLSSFVHVIPCFALRVIFENLCDIFVS